MKMYVVLQYWPVCALECRLGLIPTATHRCCKPGSTLAQCVPVCVCAHACASGPLQQAWLGEQHRDSWSNVAPCLTLSTVCSRGWRAALHTLKTCAPSRTPAGRGPHLEAWGLVTPTPGSGSRWGVRRLEFYRGLWPSQPPWHLGDLRRSHSKQPADAHLLRLWGPNPEVLSSHGSLTGEGVHRL